MEINMQYPLKEKIGNPYLLAGREKEFSNFRKWTADHGVWGKKQHSVPGSRCEFTRFITGREVLMI